MGYDAAFLKARFNTNEILVSLMLTYVAILFLSGMVYGPLKNLMDLIFQRVGYFMTQELYL